MAGVSTLFRSANPLSLFPLYVSISGLRAIDSSMSPSPPRNLSMELAALRPAEMASIIAAGPFPTSPPAKMPAIPVSWVSGLIVIKPLSTFNGPLSSINERSAAWPMASMT